MTCKITSAFIAFMTTLSCAIPAWAAEPPSAPPSENHFNYTWNGSDSLEVSVSGTTASGEQITTFSSALSFIFGKYKGIAVAILGICIITSIISLLIQITKLGTAGDNERNRTAAIKGILFSGIAIAIFGSLSVVVGIFWNAFT